MTRDHLCRSLSELDGLADNLVRLYPDNRIFALRGPMGAGKTTFIKALCRRLGVKGNITSPTFALVNEYITPDQQRIFHFDFYRIKTLTEVLDIGYEDYFFSGSYCFLEWPEKIAELLPADCVNIQIEEEEQTGLRIFNF